MNKVTVWSIGPLPTVRRASCLNAVIAETLQWYNWTLDGGASFLTVLSRVLHQRMPSVARKAFGQQGDGPHRTLRRVEDVPVTETTQRTTDASLEAYSDLQRCFAHLDSYPNAKHRTCFVQSLDGTQLHDIGAQYRTHRVRVCAVLRQVRKEVVAWANGTEAHLPASTPPGEDKQDCTRHGFSREKHGN